MSGLLKPMTIENKNIEELLEEIKKLQDENFSLKKRKKYGLVWEDKPEKFDEESKNSLPVLKEKGGKFKDVLESGKENEDYNILIEGDNYHSLSVLSYTHKNKVDVIYIDPPYNTGNEDFIYNDRFIDKEDSFRHSKWLSFMDKRLRLAKDLLKDDGVIFISIDDNEQSQLKLLCDEIFGENNRLGENSNNEIIWVKGNSDEASKNLSRNHESIICYKKSNQSEVFLERGKKNKLVEIDDKFYENKGEPYSFGMLYLNIRTSLGYTIYYNDKINDKIAIFDYDKEKAKSSNNYNDLYIDDVGLIKKGYDILIRPKKTKGKIKCWGLSLENFNTNKEKFIVKKNKKNKHILNKINLVNQNEVVKEDEHFYLIKNKQVPMESVIYDTSSSSGGIEVSDIFGESNKFNNPKSINLIKKFIKKDNSLILDFFAGSGTTGHAVLDLNKEDGGNRKFILCTNNENKICEEVTWERIKRVSKGYKKPNGEKVEGLGGNIKYLKTDFIKKNKSIDDLKEKIVEASTEILCLKENTFKEVKDDYQKNRIKIFENKKQYTAVLFDLFYFDDFIEELKKLKDKRIVIYIFSYGRDFSLEEFEELNGKVDFSVEAIPEKLLETYQKIFNL